MYSTRYKIAPRRLAKVGFLCLCLDQAIEGARGGEPPAPNNVPPLASPGDTDTGQFSNRAPWMQHKLHRREPDTLMGLSSFHHPKRPWGDLRTVRRSPPEPCLPADSEGLESYHDKYSVSSSRSQA